jgi:hypothetical protein
MSLILLKILKYLPIMGILHELSYKKGKKLLNRVNIPKSCNKNPIKANLSISKIINPPKKNKLPFIFP